MSRKQVLIKGTIILTLTGFATRFMGFFYRIFLSHTFGEEGVGIYQLIFPIYAMGFSLTSAGIELALSRSTAYYIAKNEKHKAAELLLTALLITETLSIIAMLLIQRYAGVLAASRSLRAPMRKTSYDSVLRVSFFRFAQLHLRLLSRNEEDEDSIRLATDRADYTNWFRLALIYDQLHTGAPFWNRRRSLRADCR